MEAIALGETSGSKTSRAFFLVLAVQIINGGGSFAIDTLPELDKP